MQDRPMIECAVERIMLAAEEWRNRCIHCAGNEFADEAKDALATLISTELEVRETLTVLAAHDPEQYEMIRWAYGKLCHMTYSRQEDALMLDRMKLFLLERESNHAG